MKYLIMCFLLSIGSKLYAKEIPLNVVAKDLATMILKEAQSKNRCVSVAIVDEGGNLYFFEKDPCAHLGSGETAIQKAQSANSFRKPTSDFVKAIKEGKLGILAAKGVVPIEGGLPLIINGTHKGAVGVGGATSLEDESFAKNALKNFEKKQITRR